MEAPISPHRSISSSELRRARGLHGELAERAAPAQSGCSARWLCDAMHERWQADVTLHREVIYLEACDGDVCVVRHTDATRIERHMAGVGDAGATHAMGLNAALCRQWMAFDSTGGTLTLHGYVPAPMDPDSRLIALRDFLLTSSAIKREITAR
ncbi:hypothetical protein ACPWR0_08265 [Pandoraea pneumonica]|uniref:hypothetical protein n=1 Tax=Pandoraea pneumonica TaxID=2508299 RepID=UPI003CF8799C